MKDKTHCQNWGDTYPTEKELSTETIEHHAKAHNLIANDDLIMFARSLWTEGKLDTNGGIMTDEQINELADDALNALCLYVQERIGQTDGGIASMFWSGREDIIKDYVKTEVMWLKD